MPITTQDCKDFIQKNRESENPSIDNWKRTRKYKDGSLILRDFSNNNGDVVTISENESGELSFYDKGENVMHSNWLELLTEHFSAPCYKDYDYPNLVMLDEWLASTNHGMQHNSFTEKDVYFKNEGSKKWLVVPYNGVNRKADMMIEVSELESFGYIPKPKQTGYDFVQENWHWY